jgi:hypothetical protein
MSCNLFRSRLFLFTFWSVEKKMLIKVRKIAHSSSQNKFRQLYAIHTNNDDPGPLSLTGLDGRRSCEVSSTNEPLARGEWLWPLVGRVKP